MLLQLMCKGSLNDLPVKVSLQFIGSLSVKTAK
jgi:hypothetical protein